MLIARLGCAALAGAVLAGTSPSLPPLERVGVDGRFFTAGASTFRPIFASGLALLVRAPRERAAFLDDVAGLGFNGVRVFAGALEWAKQTPRHAVQTLPSLLDEAARRGLYVLVTAVTDSASGYDVEQHLASVSAICAKASNCLLEAANEYYHPTQSPLVHDPLRLYAAAERAIRGSTWALGAPPFDAPQKQDPACRADCALGWPIPSGDYITVHLGRGDSPWVQLARLRELARVSEITGKPVFNSEPIGAAEQAQPGRRLADPEFFFGLGALSRLLELGAVFHSEDGLNGRRLRPAQRRAARAFISGFRAVATSERLALVDPAAPGSPVGSTADARHVFVARAGARAWIVLLDVGRAPRLDWQDGWNQWRVRAVRPHLRVIEARR
jgi:hypothetical protein